MCAYIECLALLFFQFYNQLSGRRSTVNDSVGTSFSRCVITCTVLYPVDSVILQYARLSCAFVSSFISYTTSLQQDIYGKYTCFSVDMSKPLELSDYNNLLLNCAIKSIKTSEPI